MYVVFDWPYYCLLLMKTIKGLLGQHILWNIVLLLLKTEAREIAWL